MAQLLMRIDINGVSAIVPINKQCRDTFTEEASTAPATAKYASNPELSADRGIYSFHVSLLDLFIG